MAPRAGAASTAATTYKLCSLLLQYPDDELLAARDGARGRRARAAALARRRGARALPAPGGPPTDPLALAQHYVETFDLDKRCGLYLTFYGHGDKRERGQALLRLRSGSTAPPGCRWRAPSCPTTCR